MLDILKQPAARTAWNRGTVVEYKRWNDTLYSLYIQSEIESFAAGQFVKIGAEIDGKVVGRPYSMVNPPHSRPLEFYCVEVPNGPLSSRLAKLRRGDEILVAPRAHGFMTLDQIPQARHLWLLATGTGVGPFLSILATDKPWQRFERVVLVYAVRMLSDLSYQERISQILVKHSGQFSFIPFLSREPSDFALSGRIPQAIIDGILEAHAGIKISANNSHFMLCGNPQMVKDTTNVLMGRGLKKHHRFDPGHITAESYW